MLNTIKISRYELRLPPFFTLLVYLPRNSSWYTKPTNIKLHNPYCWKVQKRGVNNKTVKGKKCERSAVRLAGGHFGKRAGRARRAGRCDRCVALPDLFPAMRVANRHSKHFVTGCTYLRACYKMHFY